MYATFDVTAQVHHQASYHDWMGHMRLTAQRVEGVGEHVPTRGVKRPHDASAHDALPVNAVSTVLPSQYRRDAMQSGTAARTSPALCFNWQSTGACKYGSGCRYSHANTSSGSQRPPQSGRDVCRDYRNRGHCRRGNKCRFEHVASSQGERQSGSYTSGTGANASPIGHTAVSADSLGRGTSAVHRVDANYTQSDDKEQY